MFHMLSCFDLKPEETLDDFRKSYAAFIADMKKQGLVESSGAIGRRQSDTPMDTDDERDHEYFVILSFKNREQVDQAYDYIKQHFEPGDRSHSDMYQRVQSPIFICWQDVS